MLKKFLIAVLGAIFGLYAANKFNPFAWLSFVPAYSVYDICITVYFAIADIFINSLVDYLSKRRAEISVVISASGTTVSEESNPMIELNDSGIANLCIKVNVCGKKKHFAGTRIIIPALGLATIQPSYTHQGVVVDELGNYIIKFEELLGQSEIVEFSREFRLALIREPSGEAQSERICPQITPQKLKVMFNRVYRRIVSEMGDYTLKHVI